MPELMSRGHQVLNVVHGAEVILDRILIDRAITVIVGGGVIVLVERRQPERGHAEILQIRQVLLHSLEISAVIGLRLLCDRRCPVRPAAAGRLTGSPSAKRSGMIR